MNPGSVSVVIPAQNEEATLDQVIDELRRAQPAVGEIIVVDDGSTDRSAAVAGAAGAHVVRHPVPRGYGAAVKSGILASSGEFVLTLDADGQHRAEQVARLLELGEAYDLVSGHRVRVRHSATWRLPGKWLVRALSSYLLKQRIPDPNCGLRLYRRAVIRRYLPLCSDGYSFTATSLMLCLSWGYRVAFVPVDVSPGPSQGRVTVRTGLDTLVLLLRMATLLDPLRIFLPVSGWVGLAGCLWGIPYLMAGRGVSVGALLLILTGVLLFAVGLLSDQIAQLRKASLEQRDDATQPTVASFW